MRRPAELANELQRAATDRLTGPYAQLEQALAGQNWPAALALAAEIRAQDPDYRDVSGLEDRAKRGQWSAQWLNEAQQGLAVNDFDAVRGALSQWRKVDPNNPDIPRVEQAMTDKEAATKRDEQGATAAALAAARRSGCQTRPRTNTGFSRPTPSSAPSGGGPTSRKRRVAQVDLVGSSSGGAVLHRWSLCSIFRWRYR